MGTLPIPLHLAVHVLGLTAAAGLVTFALLRRREAGPGWLGLVTGGLLLGLTYVTSGALLAQDLAWPIYARAAGYAALAVAAAGGMVGSIGVVAVVAPVAAHWAAAAAGFAAAAATLRGALGRGRETLPFAAGLLLWGGADIVVRESDVVAAVLSLLGSLAIGIWVVRQSRHRLLARFVAAFVGVLLLLVVGLASASGVLFLSDLRGDELRQLTSQAEAVTRQVTVEWPAQLVTAASSFAGDTLASEMATDGGLAPDLDRRAAQLAGQPNIDVALLVASDGRVLGSFDIRTGQPLALGDEPLLAGSDLVVATLQGTRRTFGTVALGSAELLSVGVVTVAPRGADGDAQYDRRVGALLLGRHITDELYLGSIRGPTGGADASVVIAGQVAATTLSEAAASDLAAALRGGNARQATLAGRPSFIASAPLRSTQGQVEGEIVLSSDAERLTGVEADFTRSVFGVGVLGLLIAAALAAWASSRTTRPVEELTRAAERVAGGDLDTRVSIDRADEVGRLAGAFDDMTTALSDRQRALLEAAATEVELRGRLEVLTGSIAEALISVDRDGRVQTVNPAAEAFLGIDGAEAQGRPIDKLLVGTDASGEPLLDVLGRPDVTQLRAARGSIGRAGTRRMVAATAAPLVGVDGAQVGRAYVLRDITGELEVERMKTEFLSNISHELRTPLTPIKGYAEVLRNRDVSPERTKEFATSISSSARRLERIIGMLVDYAALEAGRMEVNLQPTVLRDVVDGTLEVVRTLEPDRRITRRIARGLPQVQVDGALLSRVMQELIDNACKFSDDTVRVTAVQDGDRVRLTVRDRGVGMSPEAIATIGRDFSQGDGSATRRHGGLGLGLSIVTSILDRFGADLEVDAEPDKGTDVHVLLPIATAPRRSR